MSAEITNLRNFSLFADMDDAFLRQILPLTETISHHAGNTLHEQGDEPECCYILTAGQVHITREYPDGTEVILATENPFYVIGEISMLANGPWTGTVTAVSDCELIRISRDAVLAFCEANETIVERGINRLGERLYRQTLHIREGGIGHGHARLASALLLLCGDDRIVTDFDLPLPLLARATALEALVVRWELQQWSARGILSYDGQRISIHAPAALRELAST